MEERGNYTLLNQNTREKKTRLNLTEEEALKWKKEEGRKTPHVSFLLLPPATKTINKK